MEAVSSALLGPDTTTDEDSGKGVALLKPAVR